MPALPVGAHLVGAFFLRGDTQVPTRRQWSMMPKGITNRPGLFQPQEPRGPRRNGALPAKEAGGVALAGRWRRPTGSPDYFSSFSWSYMRDTV